MKKLPLILSIIAIIATVAMFVTMIIGHKDIGNSGTTTQSSLIGSELKIAYIQTDSVLVNYEMALDLQEDFLSKQQEYQVEIGAKQSKLQENATAFQEKVQRGGFLTEERAVRERDRIIAQEKDMQQLGNQFTNKLAQLEAEINQRIADSIISYVKKYNVDKKYAYILSNTGNIIVGDPQLNITKEVLEGLNAKYLKSKE